MPFFGFPYIVKMIDTVSILSLCKGATTMDTGHSAGEEWYEKKLWKTCLSVSRPSVNTLLKFKHSCVRNASNFASSVDRNSV